MYIIHFLLSPVFKSLGWSLLHSLWQAFVLYMLTIFVLYIIRNAASRIKYIIAYSALCATGLSFVFALVRQYNIQQSIAASNAVFIDVGFHKSMNIPLNENIIQQNGSSYVEHLLPFIVLIYFTGFLFFGIRLIYQYRKIVFLKSKGLKRIGENLETRVRQMAHQLNVSVKFKIFLSDHIQVPAMIGFLKPVILLPVAFLNNLSVEETEAILIHELAHISRKDYLFNLLQTVIETILFFNPFVWLLSKIIREEREKACDEIVVEYAAPVIYARALLSIENTAKPLLAQAVSGGKYRLLNRIKNFTIKKNNTMNAKQKIISVLIVSMGIFSIAWLSPKPQIKNIQKNIVRSSLTLPPDLYNIDTPIISVKPEVLSAPPVPPMPSKAKNEPSVEMPPPPPAVHTLPYSIQQEIDSPPAIDSVRIAKIHDFYNSGEWKKFQKQMEEKTSKINEFYNSPKWKKYQKELQRNAEKISNFYNSKQWKKSTEELMANADKLRPQSELWNKIIDTIQWNVKQENYKQLTEQLRQQMKGLQKQINDKVWKAQSAALQQQAEQFRKEAEIYRKKILDNPEWKAQQKDMEEKMRQLSNDLQQN